MLGTAVASTSSYARRWIEFSLALVEAHPGMNRRKSMVEDAGSGDGDIISARKYRNVG
jgi:hypothetical protein